MSLVGGWRDKAFVVEDDISAGSQDEGLIRHHSSSPRGPRPRPSDTPPPSKRLRHPHPPTLPTPWVRAPDDGSRYTTQLRLDCWAYFELAECSSQPKNQHAPQAYLEGVCNQSGSTLFIVIPSVPGIG